jgi:hypothetical protein
MRSALLAAGLLTVATLSEASADEDASSGSIPALSPFTLELEIDYPPDGSGVDDPACGAFVAGRALARPAPIDIAIVIDTSRSTIAPSGADIDQDGEIGSAPPPHAGNPVVPASTDAQDSILAAEVAAARRVVQTFAPGTARIAVVTFSSLRAKFDFFFNRKAAVTVSELSDDFDDIHDALDGIAGTEPEGGTNMAAALDLAVSVLRESSTPSANRAILFFTDGQPTHPHGPWRNVENAVMTFEAVQRAMSDGIRIHSVGIGPEALESPLVLVEMAIATGGSFTPVRDPSDLVSAMGALQQVAPLRVAISNASSGAVTNVAADADDGAFAVMVPVVAGSNRLDIQVHAAGSAKQERAFEITNDPDQRADPLPEPLVAARNRLLESCLRSATQRRVEIEDAVAEQVTRELHLEIEQERSRARERAAQQRKHLELYVDQTPSESGARATGPNSGATEPAPTTPND